MISYNIRIPVWILWKLLEVNFQEFSVVVVVIISWIFLFFHAFITWLMLEGNEGTINLNVISTRTMRNEEKFKFSHSTLSYAQQYSSTPFFVNHIVVNVISSLAHAIELLFYVQCVKGKNV